jgi:molybdate transport system permease protein
MVGGIRASKIYAAVIAAGTIVLVTAYLALPVLALFLRTTPEIFLATIQDKAVLDALRLSVITSLAALLVICLIGTPAAYFHARSTYPGKSIVDIFIDLPLVLPPAVAGLALLLLYGRMGLIGRYLSVFGIEVAFTTLAVVMAQIFVASPFYLRQAKGLVEQLDPTYEQTARTLGASPLWILITVVLPLIAEGLLSGAIMTFARALGEFGATIMVSGNLPGVTQTMPLAIYSAMQGNFDVAITISILLVLISFGIMAVIKILTRRRNPHA